MSRVSSIENNLEVIRNRRKKHEENPNADQEFREGRISYSDFLKNQEKYGSGDTGITGYTTDEVEPKERSQKYWAWQQENNALLDEFNEYEGTGRYQTQKQHDDYYKRLKTQLGKAVTMRKSDAYYNDEIDEAVDQLSKAIQSNTKGREYYKKWDDEESYQQDKKQKEEEYQNYLQKMKEQEETAKRAEEYKQYLDNLKNQDMDSLQTQLKDTNDKLNNVWGAYDFDALRDKKTELKSAILEKQKEEAAAEKEKISAQYENLRNSEDFGEKSQYQSTASDRPTVLARLTGNDAWGVNHDIGDEEYEYINNENLRDEIKNKYSTYGNDTGNRSSKYERLGYDYVSDEEKQIYNYLYSTKGKKDAEKYLDSLDLTARMTEDYGERFADVTRRHPIAASALSVPMGIQSGLGFVKDTADFISGKGIDEHSYYNLNANMQNKIRDTVSEEIQKAVEGTWGEAGSASYGIGMSMADYLATTAITGGNSALSLAIMGSRAAAQGVIDAKERGVSDTQAFLTGAAQGIAEIAFEKISLEQLKYFHQQGASDIAGVIKNILKGSFTEGSEEFFTSVANAITDGLINGGMSEIDTNIDQYMQNGHTAEDAKKLATEDFVKQLGMDFIGGAVSGGIMSGVATGLNYGQEGTLPENPTNVQPGSEVAPAQNQEVKVDVPEEIASVQETSTNYKQHMVDVALENGKISDSYADTIRDDAEMKAALEEKTGVSIEGTEAEQRNTIKALVETYARTQGTGAGATETNGNGINEEVQGADRKTGEWSPQDEQIRKMAELAGDGNSQEVSENFVKNYNGNLEAEDYAKAYDLFYSAGKNGVTLSDAMRSGNMFAEVAGTQAMKDAWNMGLKARNAQDQQIQLMRKQQEKAGQGLYVDEVMEDGPMKELQKAVAEKTGIDITRVRSLPHDANGMFIPSMMSMVLSTNGTNEYTSMIHELGEFGLTYDRAGMKSVQDAMIQWWAGKNGVEGLSDMNELVSEYQKRYEKAEGSKTNSQAMDEMINDAMGGLFSSDQGVEEFVNWVQKDSGMESGKQKTVLQNMADILKSLVDSIKNILSGSRLTKAAKTALQMEEDQATKIRQRFLEVIDRASENAQTKGEYVSEKQVNYELKGTDEDGVEVYETSDDVKNMTLKEKKAKLLDIMVNQYKGRTAKFVRDGETYYAQYNNAGIRKGVFGDKKSDRSGLKAKVNIGADGNYIELAENALYSGSAEESGKRNKFHRDAQSWDYYVKTIRSDGKDYDVLVNVKNTEKDHYVYDITLHEKSTTPSMRQLNPHLSSGADASTNNIASQVKSVNEINKSGTEALLKSYDERSEHFGKNQDAQYSLPEENEDLRRKNENLVRENEKYRTVIQDLRARIGANEPLTTQISQKSIDRIVNGIYKDFKSSYDKGTFKSKLSAFLNDVASGKAESRDNFTYMAEQILRPVIEESQNNLELSDYAKDVLKDIRETKISLDSVQKEEVANAFGSYNEFRKATFGRLSLSNEGVPLDSMWQEWSARYPELFDGNMNSADQANALADIVGNLKEDYVNDYGFSIEDATSFAAAELMEEYENLPEIRKLDKGKDSIDFRIKYRRLINEIKNEYKASYENQIKELKQENIETRRDMSEQMERQKAKMRERQRETREQRRVNETRKKYRNRIEKNTKTMLRWFENNTEKQHIPEVLKKPAAEFLTSLNFLHSNGDYNSNENIQLKLRLNDLFRSLSGMGDGDADFINRMDPDLLPMMNEYLTESGDTSVPELEIKQMEKLDFIVNSLKETVTKANKLYQNALYEDAYQAGEDTIRQLQTRKMKNDRSGLVGMADRLINTEMLDPYSYFRRMGKAGFSVYKEIRNGFNERTWKLQKAQNFMEETLSGQKIKKWTGKNATLHEVQIGQEKVKLTTGQIMNLYVLAQRPQALTHLTAQGGGFTITDLTNSQKRAERVIRVTPSDIETITNMLTSEQKQIAGKMQKFLAQECADWGNEVSMKMYGYKKFREKTYWPIQTNDNFGKAKNMEQKGNQSSLYAIRNQGMTKSLVKNASNPIVVGDIFDVFTDHVCNMANYNAFTVPLSDAMVWYNHQNRTDTGIAMESVREEMERAFGRGAKSYFINLIKDVNGEVTKGYGSEISDSFTGRYKAAAVGANLRVVIQQPTAYMRAMAVMDPKYLIKAATMKPAIQESQDNSAIAKWKSWGYFETGIGQSMKNVLTDQATPLEKMTEASMWAAGKADDITWGVLWNAVKAEVQDQNPGIDVKSEEYLKLVQDRFDDVVDQTQVVDTVLHRSQIMRSSNGAVKMATSFMAEPTKSFNLLRTRMTEVAASMYQDKLRGVKNSKATKAARKDLARSVVSLGLTAVATSAASAIIDGVRDDDDDKDYLEKWMDSFVANMADNTNIFGQIPYVKEVFSMVQGYDSERMDMAGISNLITSAQEAYKYANGDSKKTMYGVIKGVVRGLSQVLGVPAYNTLREIESIHNAVAKEPWDTKKLTKKTALARLDKAAQNGDEDLQKKYLQYLSDEYDKKKEQELANGKKAEDAAKAARSALMNSVTSYFKPLYQAGNTQEKIRIKNLIFKIGVDGKQLYKNYDWKSWDKKD